MANDKPFRVEERATSACAPLSATKMAANAKLALEGDRSLQLETVTLTLHRNLPDKKSFMQMLSISAD